VAAARRRERRVDVVDLDDRARRVLARRCPEVSGASAAFVVVADAEIRDAVRQGVDRLVASVNEGHRLRIEELVEALLPRIEVPTPAALEQARRQAVVRLRLLRDFGAYSPDDVSELAGSRAANRSALASRWRREGRIFAVPYDHREHYLGFQFDGDGRPLPAVAKVLAVLAGWPPWDVALWFVSDNAWLERRPPAELLAVQAQRVLRAAEADAASRAGGATPGNGAATVRGADTVSFSPARPVPPP